MPLCSRRVATPTKHLCWMVVFSTHLSTLGRTVDCVGALGIKACRMTITAKNALVHLMTVGHALKHDRFSLYNFCCPRKALIWFFIHIIYLHAAALQENKANPNGLTLSRSPSLSPSFTSVLGNHEGLRAPQLGMSRVVLFGL